MALDLEQFKFSTTPTSSGALNLGNFKVLPAPDQNLQNPPPTSFLGDVGSRIKQAVNDRAANLKNAIYGSDKQNPLSDIFQTVGQGAGLLGDILAAPIKAALTPNAKQTITSGVGSILNTASKIPIAGTDVGTVAKEAAAPVSEFATAHPEATRNLEAAGNIASLLPIGAGAGKVTEEGLPLLKGASEGLSQTASDVAESIGNKTSAMRSLLPSAATDEQKVLEMTRPVLGKAEKDALIQQGKGNVSPFLKKYTLEATPRDVERAKSVEGVVASAKNDNEAVKALNSEIKASAENVKSTLETTPKYLDKGGGTVFNKNQVRSYLSSFKESPERQIILQGDEAANKSYDGVLDTFMKILDNHPKDVSGLLAARKEFDKIAEKTIGNSLWDETGKINPRTLAVRDVRRQANEYIINQLPQGDALRGVLHRQNLMFEARDNISDKIVPKIGTNIIGRTTKAIQKHPVISTVVGVEAANAGLNKILGK